MRLDKVLSNLKYGSRKDVKNMIKNGAVLVNGKAIFDADYKIDINCDKITLNGKEIYLKEHVYLAFYKPKGFLSSHKDEIHPSLFKLIKEPYNRYDLKIAGRLDHDAEGLMILTNDGSFIHEIVSPNRHVQKTYEILIDKVFKLSDKNKLLEGVEITLPDSSIHFTKALDLIFDENIVKMTIDEGKFHQVKKMMKSVGYEVLNLKRIQIGNLKLNLKEGAYQEIDKADVLG